MQKIRDPEAGPKVAYLLRDLDDKVQSAAVETVGVLRTKDALPALRNVIGDPRNKKDRKSTRLNSSHANISYAVFCLKKKNTDQNVNDAHIQFWVILLKQNEASSVCLDEVHDLDIIVY